MEIINFLIGQLVGLVEPFLAIDFIIKCLGWKEGGEASKAVIYGTSDCRRTSEETWRYGRIL